LGGGGTPEFSLGAASKASRVFSRGRSIRPCYCSVVKTAGTPEELRRWADCWKLAGEIFDEIKRSDLARMDEVSANRSLRLLSSDERLWFDRKAGSGLVEQQRIFQRLKRR
jgi:hypothetical protein